jgi:hypothetical protein
VNVNHDCVTARCTIERTRAVFQEREKVGETADEVKHRAPLNRFVLNLGQMRDADILDSFRPPIEREPRDKIVQAAAEEALRQRKAKTRSKGKGKEMRPPSISGPSSSHISDNATILNTSTFNQVPTGFHYQGIPGSTLAAGTTYGGVHSTIYSQYNPDLLHFRR